MTNSTVENISSLPQAWYQRNALIIGALMLASSMGMVGVPAPTIGSGRIAPFIAIVPMLVALIVLAFGNRPSLPSNDGHGDRLWRRDFLLAS